MSVRETQSAAGVNISVTGGDSGWTGGDADSPRLEIYVPRKSDLKIITRGEIRLEGVTGEIDLSGSDNSIDIRGSEGKLNVSNTNGIVRVVGFKGEVIAKTGDGEVYLDGDFCRIDARSADGKFILTVPAGLDADIEVPTDTMAVEEIPNGQKISDTSWRLGKGGKTYKFNSTDGSLEVRNREEINAER